MGQFLGSSEWIRQPGYPELTGKQGAESITEKYTATASGLKLNLPTFGSYFKSEDPFYGGYGHLSLSDRRITLHEGGQVYDVTLVWSPGDDSSNNAEAPVLVDWEDVSETDTPAVSNHPKYRYNWDHVLLAKKGITSSPSWWNDAKTKKMSAEDQLSYLWQGKDDEVPTGYYVLCDAQMVATNYYRAITKVSCTKRSTNLSLLQNDKANDCTPQTPGRTFGASGEWLRLVSTIRKNGKYWELTVLFVCSDEIDNRLYK